MLDVVGGMSWRAQTHGYYSWIATTAWLENE